MNFQPLAKKKEELRKRLVSLAHTIVLNKIANFIHPTRELPFKINSELCAASACICRVEEEEVSKWIFCPWLYCCCYCTFYIKCTFFNAKGAQNLSLNIIAQHHHAFEHKKFTLYTRCHPNCSNMMRIPKYSLYYIGHLPEI